MVVELVAVVVGAVVVVEVVLEVVEVVGAVLVVLEVVAGSVAVVEVVEVVEVVDVVVGVEEVVSTGAVLVLPLVVVEVVNAERLRELTVVLALGFTVVEEGITFFSIDFFSIVFLTIGFAIFLGVVFTVDFDSTFVVTFGAISVSSAADAIEGVTRLKRAAVLAIRADLFMIPFQPKTILGI